MKRLTHIFRALFCLCLPAVLNAQDVKDSKYLAGAVPEVDGKVVFTKEFSIPGMSQKEVYDRAYKWMDQRLQKNENESRIVYTEENQGQIVGVGNDWIIFTSNAISLDRTQIHYQITVNCTPEKCVLEVSKIRFVYREGKEKYTAEEWIADKYALNKTQTKLIRGLAKWRKKSVDFIDEMTQDLANALSTVEEEEKPQAVEEAEAEKSSTIVITPKKQTKVEVVAPTVAVAAVTTEAPQVEAAVEAPQVAAAVEAPQVVAAIEEPQVVAAVEEPQVVAAVEAPAVTTEVTTAVAEEAPKAVAIVPETAATTTKAGYKTVAPEELSTNAIQTTSGKLVITIGEDVFNTTTFTANSGGALGKVNNKPVVFSILSPEQSYEQMEKATEYAVRFYPNGSKEPSVILECKQLPSPTAVEGMPRTYIGEIVSAAVKE